MALKVVLISFPVIRLWICGTGYAQHCKSGSFLHPFPSVQHQFFAFVSIAHEYTKFLRVLELLKEDERNRCINEG